jgi:CHAD domain-containing protein
MLREAFSQFETNLMVLRKSDDPEVVHQARVGWRRFRSALRLFKPALTDKARPLSLALPSLLNLLSELRDLDVAWHDTLPPLQEAYTA